MCRWKAASLLVLLLGVVLNRSVVNGQQRASDPFADYPDTGAADGSDMCGCPEEYTPVCGYDGTTYVNSCIAQCLDAVVIHDGECAEDAAPATSPAGAVQPATPRGAPTDQPVPECKKPCPADNNVVCGNDQRTYANPCSAACNGAETFTLGACEAIKTAAAPAASASPKPKATPAPQPSGTGTDPQPSDVYNPVFGPQPGDDSIQCPPPYDTQKYKTTSFTDTLATTTAIHPKRPTSKVPKGAWIPGRATYYGTDARIEKSRVDCGEPEGQFGILEHGNCGYTDGDGGLSYPADGYAAAADANADYPGACGRCYQIRCRSGAPENNGRPLRISDVVYYTPYQMKDNAGRDWPGNPYEPEDLFYTQCWDESKVITVRIGDACPCQYFIKYTNETRTQPWCCGGHNHFDLSVWAFQKLAHPSYGVMKMEYRPVDCATNQPLEPLPGFVNQTIYDNGIGAGWTWRPYFAKNHVLLAKGQGLFGSNATCSSLSKNGAVSFVCQHCTKPGYQPLGKADYLRFWIRSNSPNADPYGSSTPKGLVPPLKIFMMNEEKSLYCGQEVMLDKLKPEQQDGDWYKFRIPLTRWECSKGSAGSRGNVNRIDFQNVNVRDANICLDSIALVK